MAWVIHSQSDKISNKDSLEQASSIVYELPFLPGKKVSIAQGYNGGFSHKGVNALDFNMRKCQIICAARSGVVYGLKEDSKKGGASRKYINDGNYIIVKHADSTYAAYWHLNYNGVLVDLGDSVLAGDSIGLVGSTGFSSGPHLHFEVYYYDHKGFYKTLKTPFNTTRGVKMPKGWHFYRKPKFD